MATETELKLAVSPTALKRLARTIAARVQREATVEHLHTVYFDTPGCGLWQQGIALRVRQDGRGRTQCVKGRGAVEAGVHRRIEVETPLDSETPDLARIGDPDLAAAVARAAQDATLQPVFTTEFTRRTFTLAPAPDTAIELALDRGSVKAGKRHEPICEIELELKTGPVWRLYDLALELERAAPVRVEHRSKAERGYALVGGVAPAPVKAKPLRVDDGMSALEAFRAICFACIDQMQANRDGLLAGGDIEYLHQMRVALRRLRSAFSAFSRLLPKDATAPALAAIHRLGLALGSARDWDVFEAATLAPLLVQHPNHRGLQAIRAACEDLHGRARKTARRAVASRRYQWLLLALGGWLTRTAWTSALSPKQTRKFGAPAREYAVTALKRRLRQVLRRGRHLSRLDAGELHRLRIATKKLRYAAAFFAPLAPGDATDAALRNFEALQDALGGLNDCETAERLLRSALTRAAADAADAGALVLGQIESARAEYRRAMKAEWPALRDAGEGMIAALRRNEDAIPT